MLEDDLEDDADYQGAPTENGLSVVFDRHFK